MRPTPRKRKEQPWHTLGTIAQAKLQVITDSNWGIKIYLEPIARKWTMMPYKILYSRLNKTIKISNQGCFGKNWPHIYYFIILKSTQ